MLLGCARSLEEELVVWGGRGGEVEGRDGERERERERDRGGGGGGGG